MKIINFIDLKRYFSLPGIYLIFFIFSSIVQAADEDQRKQAQDSAILAERSAQLYRQIADLANHSSTLQTKKRMAELEEILNNLKANKVPVLHQISEERSKPQENELYAAKPQGPASLKELAQRASDINDDIIRLSHQQDYGTMKEKLTELDETLAALAALKDETAKEEMHRKEVLPEQEQGREVKIKQELINRQEAQSSLELERQEGQLQSQLEARRKAVRKQLEAGVEIMYEGAWNSYQEGNYKAAADKFKDVLDILPGYKNAGFYMDEARQKSMTVKPQVVNVPSNMSVVPASSMVSREDIVSKTLDLFDSNVK